MRKAARARQFGHLLAVLLVLLGVGAAVAPSAGAADGFAGQHRISVTGGSVSPEPSMHDDLQDWLRLSVGTPRAPSTAMPDTWWAVCPGAAGVATPRQRSLAGAVDRGVATTATPARPSSRAPPLA